MYVVDECHQRLAREHGVSERLEEPPALPTLGERARGTGRVAVELGEQAARLLAPHGLELLQCVTYYRAAQQRDERREGKRALGRVTVGGDDRRFAPRERPSEVLDEPRLADP